MATPAKQQQQQVVDETGAGVGSGSEVLKQIMQQELIEVEMQLSPLLLDLEGMEMPNASALNQLMQDPAWLQMMQSLLSNPKYMDQMLNLSPQLLGMFDMNPETLWS